MEGRLLDHGRADGRQWLLISGISGAEFGIRGFLDGWDPDTGICSGCHGSEMADPQAAFDLRKFPRDEKGRFVNAVRNGKNNMPPWGDLLGPDDVDALWAYVMSRIAR